MPDTVHYLYFFSVLISQLYLPEDSHCNLDEILIKSLMWLLECDAIIAEEIIEYKWALAMETYLNI